MLDCRTYTTAPRWMCSGVIFVLVTVPSFHARLHLQRLGQQVRERSNDLASRLHRSVALRSTTSFVHVQGCRRFDVEATHKWQRHERRQRVARDDRGGRVDASARHLHAERLGSRALL